MKFSITVAMVVGLVAAGPLKPREPQFISGITNGDDQPLDGPLPDDASNDGFVGPNSGLVAPPPPSKGTKNSQGFSQELCDILKQRTDVDAATFGC
ncbi:hypothetical protein ED733_000385 [Metarhizium rileyi]|uniref:Uncharacterized protein n=1 Tax=Metarhizium rileyi (strain RCEF 4871) TaxID=1649241 RepID=A0A5C6G4B5_METRR|nr:hypothetical protein ED733_000385 [Metarhizium rileyi]